MGVHHTFRNLAVLGLAAVTWESLIGDEPHANVTSTLHSRSEGSVPVARQVELPAPVSPLAGNEQESHPLTSLLEMAREASQRIESDVRDYTCTLIKRERVDGILLPAETIFAKVRHLPDVPIEPQASEQPFSVYLRFESPRHLSGREILYHHTCDEDPLLVRNGGTRLAFITLQLAPDCPLAMRGNRYPITQFGIQKLVARMIRLGEQELNHQECEVQIDEGLLLEDRRCRCIEVRHPVRRPHFAYHLARIYVDEELELPIRFEAYDWPSTEGEPPQLIEDYTYHDLKINVGLDAQDFAPDHPDYRFSGHRTSK